MADMLISSYLQIKEPRSLYYYSLPIFLHNLLIFFRPKTDLSPLPPELHSGLFNIVCLACDDVSRQCTKDLSGYCC